MHPSAARRTLFLLVSLLLLPRGAGASIITVSAASLPSGPIDESTLPGVLVQAHRYSISSPPVPLPPTIVDLFVPASVGQIPSMPGSPVFGNLMLSATNVLAFWSGPQTRGFHSQWFWLEFQSPTNYLSVETLGQNGFAPGLVDPTDYQVQLFGYDASKNPVASTGWVDGEGLTNPVPLSLSLASPDIKYAEVQWSFGEYYAGYVREFSFAAVPELSPSILLLSASIILFALPVLSSMTKKWLTRSHHRLLSTE